MKKQVKLKLIGFLGTLLLASLLILDAAPPGSQPTNAVIGRPGFGQRMGMIGPFEEATKVIGSQIEATKCSRSESLMMRLWTWNQDDFFM